MKTYTSFQTGRPFSGLLLAFNFTTAQVVCLTAMINHFFVSFSAVQIYDMSYIHLQDS